MQLTIQDIRLHRIDIVVYKDFCIINRDCIHINSYEIHSIRKFMGRDISSYICDAFFEKKFPTVCFPKQKSEPHNPSSFPSFFNFSFPSESIPLLKSVIHAAARFLSGVFSKIVFATFRNWLKKGRLREAVN